MNINETTGEKINRSDYSNIREDLYNKSLNWNGVWKIWNNPSPDGIDTVVYGSGGFKIRQWGKIPDDRKDVKRRNYTGRSGEIAPNVTEESDVIHTVGNENNIREKVKSLNLELIKNYSPLEYKNAGEYYVKKIKSYKIKLLERNTANDIISEQECWTENYENFEPETVIGVYEDKDLTSFIGNFNVVSVELNPYKKTEIVWTGDRYIIDVESQNAFYDYVISYSNPINMNNNNSRNVVVYNKELGKNTYKLFNNKDNYLQFSKLLPTEKTPIIIEFRLLDESLKLTKYDIRADNRNNEWETPADWTIEASDDGMNWKVIDRRINEDDGWSRNTTRSFVVNPDKEYAYFRMVITRKRETSKKYLELGGMRFHGLTAQLVNIDSTETKNIGNKSDVDVASLGVVKYSQLSKNPDDVYNDRELLNNPESTSNIDYSYLPDSNIANQNCVYTFNVNQNWELDNEHIVRKSDLEQVQKLLEKIGNCLRMRDGWFDSNDRCQRSCQVNCQTRCQASCQGCNTKQCHDQKCGTH